MKLSDKIRVNVAKVTLVGMLGAMAPVVLPVCGARDLIGGGPKALKDDLKTAGKGIKACMLAKDMNEWDSARDVFHKK